jgi:hypothetical protein
MLERNLGLRGPVGVWLAELEELLGLQTAWWGRMRI